MTAPARCVVCRRPLHDRASIAEGAGPVCAVRRAQVPLELDAAADAPAPSEPATDYAATDFDDWPWVRACREDAAARGVACRPGCPGETYGRCARCAGEQERAAQKAARA
jgi:hypothetical protein